MSTATDNHPLTTPEEREAALQYEYILLQQEGMPLLAEREKLLDRVSILTARLASISQRAYGVLLGLGKSDLSAKSEVKKWLEQGG